MKFFISKINPAGDGSFQINCLYLLTKLNLLSIGWSKIAEYPNSNGSKADIDLLIKKYYKNDSKLQNEATSLDNFINQIKIGDIAITPIGYGDSNKVYFSKIISDKVNAQKMDSNNDLEVFKDEISYLRKIEIIKEIELGKLPKELKKYIKDISSLNTCFPIIKPEIKLEIIEIL